MYRGVIAKLSSRGFGFIHGEGNSSDIYFHATDMAVANTFNSLEVGDKVEYGMQPDSERPRACRVAVLP